MTTTARLVLNGLGFPESTRWHDGRVWVCNWGAGEVLAATSGGEREVTARLAPRTIPFSIDWLSGRAAAHRRRAPGTAAAPGAGWCPQYRR